MNAFILKFNPSYDAIKFEDGSRTDVQLVISHGFHNGKTVVYGRVSQNQ